jgi:copper chaperone NosL
VDGHRHLTVAGQEDPAGRASWHRGLRWLVVGLSGLAIAAYVASFFQVWWRFTLYAPQYPHGLRLAISLTGMGGDVHEIDMLNHYIGMGHLADAASRERELAGWGVAFIAILVLAITLGAGKRLGKAIVVPGIAFPVVFLGDAFYWLHRFGHGLDPRAPLHIPPFTPELFGNGQIGQFMTFAVPGPGFWLATVALGLLGGAAAVRARVCRDCPLAGDCGVTCPRALIGPAPKEAP